MLWDSLMLVGETVISSNEAENIALLLGVHLKTVQRWFRVKEFPRPVALLLRLVYGGELGLISPEWEGFWIQKRYGCMVTDQGYTFGPGEVRGWQIRQHQIAHLQRRVKELEAERDALLVPPVGTDQFDFPVVPFEPLGQPRNIFPNAHQSTTKGKGTG